MKIKDDIVLQGMTQAAADEIEYNTMGAFQTSDKNTHGYYIFFILHPEADVWEYEDSNESNWSNHARECYPIAVSITVFIYLGFSQNIKVYLETSRFLSKHKGFSRNQLHQLYSYLYIAIA